jgi:hypothetical protein
MLPSPNTGLPGRPQPGARTTGYAVTANASSGPASIDVGQAQQNRADSVDVVVDLNDLLGSQIEIS